MRWIGCSTSQSTIFQSYMWRHIDVQADWRWSHASVHARILVQSFASWLNCTNRQYMNMYKENWKFESRMTSPWVGSFVPAMSLGVWSWPRSGRWVVLGRPVLGGARHGSGGVGSLAGRRGAWARVRASWLVRIWGMGVFRGRSSSHLQYQYTCTSHAEWKREC